MDESWRMRMGKPTSAACFKTKHAISGHHRSTTDKVPHRKSSENSLLEADDFNDVFGGPPRTVISRQFSGNEYYVFPAAGGSSSSSSCFYEDVFQPKEKLGSPTSSPARGRKSLPEFLGPVERGTGWRSDQFEGFYGDIFGWKEEEMRRSKSRSRSKSKMGSSWVLSSEDMSPSKPAVGAGVFDDDDIALLASKLRSINVSRWDSNEATEEDIHKEHHGISSNYPSSRFEYDSIDNIIRSSNIGFRRKNPSPEDTYPPPSSVASSLSKDHEAPPVCGTMQGDNIEAMRSNSYVIEIDGNQGKEERDDAIGVEDAIAWAKEKYQTYCSHEEELIHTNQFSRNPDNFNESTFATENGESDDWSSAEDKEPIDNNNMEMEVLNEKIRLWSSGKEADIRLLLSTLHHVLWEDNRWVAVPLTNLIESRDVKKVYQTARLLLHPDKLQQKGATFLQKYIAEKAFPILQDAWAAFVSQDD